MIVEQFLPAFHYGDATGNSALRLHEFLEKQGIESRIVALTIDKNVRDRALFFSDYRDNSQAVKILHFAVPSPLTDFFLKTSGKKVLVYHNITPPHFFVDFSEHLVRMTTEGRHHLKRLNDCFDLSTAVSHYNAKDLQELQFRNIQVFPLMISLKDFAKPHSQAFCNLFQDGRKNIIFVGRITPNKKVEDLVKMLFFYKKYISPSIRLIVAGNTRTLPQYFFAVQDLAARFLLTSEDIFFTGHIPFAELLSVYRLADLFVSMSEHEGFCGPLIESCYFEIPILAYDAGAISETLKGAGITFKEKKYEWVAGMTEKIIFDNELNSCLKGLARDRVNQYLKDSDPAGFLTLLQQL
jgi:glycosyltransferase involved in cell wall biosynthesis